LPNQPGKGTFSKKIFIISRATKPLNQTWLTIAKGPWSNQKEIKIRIKDTLKMMGTRATVLNTSNVSNTGGKIINCTAEKLWGLGEQGMLIMGEGGGGANAMKKS